MSHANARRSCPGWRQSLFVLLALLGLWCAPRAWAIDISSCPIKISASGDYHVTQDLSCPSSTKPAIEVDADNVTLSLDGHTITGPGGMVFSSVGIAVASHSGVSISNGSISAFGFAVDIENGGTSVTGLTVTNCDTGVTIEFGSSGNMVSDNSFTGCDFGIEIGGPNNGIFNNTSNNNSTGISINDPTATGNTVEANTALHNSRFDLEDITTHCDSNSWNDNCFMTESQSCIGTSACSSSVSITCPQSRTVNATFTNPTSATVDVGTPTTTPAGLPVAGVRADNQALTDPFPLGTTTITWTVNPGQETAQTCMQTVTVNPPGAPTITCPGNKNVTVATGQTSATVTVGMATTNAEGAEIVGVRSDGLALTDPYPVGTTTITWMVTFDEQEPVTCTQTITVQAAPAFPFIVHGPSDADPHIDSIFVNRGPVYQKAIIHGSGFADVQGTSYVTLGGHQIPVLSWTNVAIGVLINPEAFNQSAVALNAAYPVQVVIPANGKKSNTVDFFLTDGPPPDYPNQASEGLSDQPVFRAFQRTLFCPGDTVAFLGSGFGPSQNTGFVTVTVPLTDQQGNMVTQEFLEPVLGWSEYSINFLLDLPSGAAPGIYTVTVHRSNGKTAAGSFIVGARDSSGNCIDETGIAGQAPS